MEVGPLGEREDAAKGVEEGRAYGQDHAPTHVLKTGEYYAEVVAQGRKHVLHHVKNT